MVRPSDNSTDNVSKVTCTCSANVCFVSTVEELIPTLHQVFVMFFNNFFDLVDLLTTKSVTSFESDRVEPEFRFGFIVLDVHMSRFAAIAGIEKEPVWPLL